MPPDDGRWFLVVPVKRLEVAKTRLGPPYDRVRRELALAFALDTTVAALASPLVEGVVAVTDDTEAARALVGVGADVVPDEPDAGLNPALSHGAAVAARSRPDCAAGALSADLPALRPQDLTTALRRGAAHASGFVRDADGAGTTLVTARDPTALRPSFGADSARRHAETGHHEIASTDLASLRRDVDTAADLVAARRLGVGPHTTALLASWDRFAPVQATVRSFDSATRSGTVLLDDGVELAYGREAFDAGDIRLLRVGQRVRIETRDGATGRTVTYLTIATLPDRRT